MPHSQGKKFKLGHYRKLLLTFSVYRGYGIYPIHKAIGDP
jgi:hypothetical protein